jgi:uncharacterized membrane protein
MREFPPLSLRPLKCNKVVISDEKLKIFKVLIIIISYYRRRRRLANLGQVLESLCTAIDAQSASFYHEFAPTANANKTIISNRYILRIKY